MRKPLSPLKAFELDARSAAERAVDIGDALVMWLSIAQSADQLPGLRGARRDEAVRQAIDLLRPLGLQRPTMQHDRRAAPTEGIEFVAEQFRSAAEAMERAGCFELAYTTVSAICRLTARAGYVAAALATVHLGRIARQMNDLSSAEDCYASMVETCVRERDGPLEARGHIGFALLHDMRGNLPAAEAEYLVALHLAEPSGSTCVAACQGLMSIAIANRRLADALLYGWRLYDMSEHDLDARTSVLADLSVVALHAGFAEAASRGFEHALTLSRLPRIRLDTLAGAIRAAARLGDRARVERYDGEILTGIATVNYSHITSFALLCAAEAWSVVGEIPTARARVEACLDVARRFGHHEQFFRAEQLSQMMDREDESTSYAGAADEPVSYRGNPRDAVVVSSIRRLEALAV
jgi:hypothetical protein